MKVKEKSLLESGQHKESLDNLDKSDLFPSKTALAKATLMKAPFSIYKKKASAASNKG